LFNRVDADLDRLLEIDPSSSIFDQTEPRLSFLSLIKGSDAIKVSLTDVRALPYFFTIPEEHYTELRDEFKL
jgi:hypothetical protein